MFLLSFLGNGVSLVGKVFSLWQWARLCLVTVLLVPFSGLLWADGCDRLVGTYSCYQFDVSRNGLGDGHFNMAIDRFTNDENLPVVSFSYPEGVVLEYILDGTRRQNQTGDYRANCTEHNLEIINWKIGPSRHGLSNSAFVAEYTVSADGHLIQENFGFDEETEFRAPLTGPINLSRCRKGDSPPATAQ